jgi:hypothetical protein
MKLHGRVPLPRRGTAGRHGHVTVLVASASEGASLAVPAKAVWFGVRGPVTRRLSPPAGELGTIVANRRASATDVAERLDLAVRLLISDETLT